VRGRVGCSVEHSSHATDGCGEPDAHYEPRVGAHETNGESRRVKTFSNGSGDEESSAGPLESRIQTF
jgi:hypothetical protein